MARLFINKQDVLMAEKKFILCADDFGVNNNINKGILEGCNAGIITAASLCANGEEFESAVNEFLPDCPDISIGAHLNITLGKALSRPKLLTDANNKFNNTFLSLKEKTKSSEFLSDVEKEFRAQIEKILEYTKINCLNSHGHIHSIPAVFKITCKLASEYNIPFVRLTREEIILVKNSSKFLNMKFPISLAKVLLMNSFAKTNEKTALEFGIRTNSNTIGELYRGFLDTSTVEESVNDCNDNRITECIIIPDRIKRKTEYELACNKIISEKIFRAGYELTNYKKLK